MTLDEVLTLRPPEGSSAATIAAAIRRAETRRAELLTATTTAEQVRALACIDAALPRIRLDLEAALVREAIAAELEAPRSG